MRPLVSIITVTRNLIDAGRKDFFRQCIESVRMQDYPNIEHLIIDGASTDGTVELLQELGINYISEPDKGIHNASNKGIKRAKGKYVAFLCSDDYYICKNSVSTSVAALEASNGDFSYAAFDIVDNDGRKIQEVRPQWNRCFSSQPFGHPTMFSRKNMLENLNGFNESYAITGDFDLITRALLRGYRPVEIKESIVAFRQGGASSPSERLKEENVRVIETNCGVSHKQAVCAVQYGFLPKKTLSALLDKTTGFPDRCGLLKRNRKQFFKYLLKQLLTLRLRKGKRCFRLLGITFYNEVKL